LSTLFPYTTLFRSRARDVSEFFGTAGLHERPGREAHVIRNEPGAQTDAEHQKRNNHEIAGPRDHRQRPQRLIRTGLTLCSENFTASSLLEHVLTLLHRPPRQPQRRPDDDGQRDQADPEVWNLTE